jgi:hypothetical protein
MTTLIAGQALDAGQSSDDDQNLSSVTFPKWFVRNIDQCTMMALLGSEGLDDWHLVNRMLIEGRVRHVSHKWKDIGQPSYALYDLLVENNLTGALNRDWLHGWTVYDISATANSANNGASRDTIDRLHEKIYRGQTAPTYTSTATVEADGKTGVGHEPAAEYKSKVKFDADGVDWFGGDSDAILEELKETTGNGRRLYSHMFMYGCSSQPSTQGGKHMTSPRHAWPDVLGIPMLLVTLSRLLIGGHAVFKCRPGTWLSDLYPWMMATSLFESVHPLPNVHQLCPSMIVVCIGFKGPQGNQILDTKLYRDIDCMRRVESCTRKLPVVPVEVMDTFNKSVADMNYRLLAMRTLGSMIKVWIVMTVDEHCGEAQFVDLCTSYVPLKLSVIQSILCLATRIRKHMNRKHITPKKNMWISTARDIIRYHCMKVRRNSLEKSDSMVFGITRIETTGNDFE